MSFAPDHELLFSQPSFQVGCIAMKRFLQLLSILLVGSLPGIERALAQPYPSRPITLIVPFAAGGGTDIIARIVADKMSGTLGQQIVVENRPGAAGTTAMRQVAKSAPDGYTLGQGNPSTLAMAPSIYPNLGYDPRRDFAPIGLVGTTPLVLIVHPSVPAQSVPELIALAKKDPGRLTFGSGGTGGVTHLAGELFASMATIKISHIPYKGIAPAINDLLGGHVAMAFSGLPPTISHVTDGKLRALAVTGLTRSKIFPTVPTVADVALPGYEATQRFGIVSPKGTPRTIVEKLNAALREALASEDVQMRMAFDGTEPLPSTPEDYAADIDREETKWSKIIRQAGLKPQ
jgi:tripartite-type tricarboxylate transporter receptor subunit TctC